MRYILFKFLLYLALLIVNLLLAHQFTSMLIDDIEAHPLTKYLWQIGVYLLFYFYFRLFHNRMVTSNESYLILKANLLSLITIFSVIFLSKEAESYSRTFVLSFFLLNGLLPLWVYVIKRRMMVFPWLRVSVIAVCDDAGMQNIQQWFQRDNAFGFDVSEYVMIGNVGHDARVYLEERLQETQYHAAIVAIDNYSVNRTFYYMELLQHYLSRVIVLPRMTKLPLVNAEIFSSVNHKGLAFAIKNNLLNPVDRTIKQLFDFTVTTLLIVAASPVFLVVFMMVFLETGGRPLFKHRRIGKDGKAFDVYKFTTMRKDAAHILEELLANDPSARLEWEREFKLKNDPRVTPVGGFLRKTSLDELPQLLNVLRGEMSLIGPRPITEDEVEKYGEYYRYFTAVKPGITGLWQISGRNDVSYDERVQLDVWYVKNWSMEIDLVILIKTLIVVLSGKGSY